MTDERKFVVVLKSSDSDTLYAPVADDGSYMLYSLEDLYREEIKIAKTKLPLSSEDRGQIAIPFEEFKEFFGVS